MVSGILKTGAPDGEEALLSLVIVTFHIWRAMMERVSLSYMFIIILFRMPDYAGFLEL